MSGNHVFPQLELVNERIFAQTTKPLSAKPKENTETAEKCNKTHGSEKRRNITGLYRPRCNKFAESVAPKVFVTEQDLLAPNLPRIESKGTRYAYMVIVTKMDPVAGL